MEHEEQGRRLEREADDMEERSENLGRDIDEARSDWESKQGDSNVPGAQPEQAEEDTPDVPGEEGTATGNPGAAGAEDQE
jgi:hypothetical protein